MTNLSFYNTLTRQKEEFKPMHEGKVSLYACGPTVYWFAHIGNMRYFLFVDVLSRALRANGYEVKQVMNITDVGHLTGDVDEGEDKMIVAMRREGKTAAEIAQFYTDAFLQDIDRLNIKRANIYPKATEHIPEQIEMVKHLEKNGYTYQTSDGIYFDTAKLANYGRLSGQRSDEKKAGARVVMGEKRNATDFALWKLSNPRLGSHEEQRDEGSHLKREMEWDSPWGVGFPGWHIECSAMSMKYLDVPFDIHTGGVDHIAVHHENEIAQTQGAENELEANVWMHSEFLTLDNGKMSKSLGNLYTIDDLIKKNYDPLAFRYFVLGAHYRSKMNFTFEALDGAQNALTKLRDIVRAWDEPDVGCADLEEKFFACVNDDLNTPEALAVVWELVNADLPTASKSESLLRMDQVLGLHLKEYVAHPLEVPSEVQRLVDERERARTKGDWKHSDELRLSIETLGYRVEDTSEGSRVKKMS